MPDNAREVWAMGEPYEQYVGRWSRVVAREFLAWLDAPAGQTWGDVGCGTGALAAGILAAAGPQAVFATDRSAGFLGFARSTIPDRRVQFAVGDAAAIPWAGGRCAVTVSGLMLNFVPDAAAALREMARVTRPGGRVALYVWDYHAGMEMMRQFWDAAIELDPAAAALDEGARFPLCQPEPLRALFEFVGLGAVAVRSIDIPTVFRNFDAYWTPFLGQQGSAPTYLASLDPQARERLRAALRARLVAAADGSITLSARAWAVQGTV
jgi:SAM-dependent methyltransferase